MSDHLWLEGDLTTLFLFAKSEAVVGDAGAGKTDCIMTLFLGDNGVFLWISWTHRGLIPFFGEDDAHKNIQKTIKDLYFERFADTYDMCFLLLN